ncbi:MAG: hypothetical protein AABX74_03075, partial [Nanoarchaeota archaeon]
FEIKTEGGVSEGELCSRLRKDSGGLLDELKAHIRADESRETAYAIFSVNLMVGGGLKCGIEVDYRNSEFHIQTHMHEEFIRYSRGEIVAFFSNISNLANQHKVNLEGASDRHTLKGHYTPDVLKGYLSELSKLITDYFSNR